MKKRLLVINAGACAIQRGSAVSGSCILNRLTNAEPVLLPRAWAHAGVKKSALTNAQTNKKTCGCAQMCSVCSGIVLIELLIYFLLLMVLGVLLFQGAVAIQTRLYAADAKTAANLSLHAAADVLSRDLRTAPAKMAGWQKLGPSELGWRTDSAEITWYCDNRRLCRAHKNYDKVKKKWGDRFVSIVAQGIARVSLQPVLSSDSASRVIKVFFTLEHEKQGAVQGVVAMRNREGA